jgi:glycerol-3-phosphate dehydrogenase (NAD(P)+)
VGRIAVIGAGAWGTALAVAFARAHPVTLWARRAGQRTVLRERRVNPYLDSIELPAAIALPETVPEALAEADLAVVATSTAGLREALAQVRAVRADLPVLWACKGLEQGSALFPHQIAESVLGPGAVCGALSGPSFALEVARGLPTALTLASRDEAFASEWARRLHQRTLRVYFSTDVVGVEVGGAVKNVLAIATGICDALGLGNNARAALITRGLAEMTRLALALGGRAETCMGLTGAGDLILTCTGELSRNRRVGLALGAGERLDQILDRLGHVAEGVHAARSVEQLAREHAVEMPITAAVCRVLDGTLDAATAAGQLLGRDPRAEGTGRAV